MIINQNFKRYFFAIIFAVVLVLLPSHQVHANWFTEWSFELVFGNMLWLIFSIAGKMIAALATLLNWAIHIPVYPDKGIAVIDKSWEIMRNFANMFFIIALILMAFATIFDVVPGLSKYNARSLFGKFLFTALLINFSLVLGVLVIHGTQVLTNTFLTAIGDMANRLGQDLNPSQLLPSQSTISAAVSTDAVVFGTLSTLVFSIVLIFTFLFSILTAFIFVFIRIPILWALLIVSPIAWIMNVFPAGQGTFKRWWDLFIGWNMFLPIYLFFLYFGLYFLSNQSNIIQSIAAEVSNAKITESLPFSLQLVFFYMMTAIFMIGGTIVAMKASMFSGTGVVQVAKWGRGVVLDRFGYTGAARAVKGRYEEHKEDQEGAIQRQAALFRTQFGRFTGGRTDAQDRQLAADVQKNKDKFAGNTDAQLTAQMSKGRRDEKLAAAEILNQRGLLNSTQLQQTYALYGANTLAGKQFARSLNYDKMTQVEREDWLGRVPDIETIKKILQAMADKGDSYIKNEQNLNRALELFKLEGDQRDLLKKIEKHELAIATKIQMDRGFLKDDQGIVSNDINRAMKVVIGRMNPDALLEATRTITTNLKLSAVAKDSLNQQKIIAMMAKGTEAQLDAWKTIDDRFDADKIKADLEEAEKRKAQYLADALKNAGVGGSGSGGAPPTGGSPAGPGPVASPLSGRGTGQYRGPVGFAPSAPAPTPPRGGVNVNPSNVVNLRNPTQTPPGTGTRPSQNPIEYLKANLEFFDRSNQLKAAEELLSQGRINQQEYENAKKKYQDIQDKVSDLDLRGGLPNNFKRLTTRQDFERKLKELQP